MLEEVLRLRDELIPCLFVFGTNRRTFQQHGFPLSVELVQSGQNPVRSRGKRVNGYDIILSKIESNRCFQLSPGGFEFCYRDPLARSDSRKRFLPFSERLPFSAHHAAALLPA